MVVKSFISRENPIGPYIRVYRARSRLSSIDLSRVGGGGAITALLSYMLDNGIVDAVVTAKRVRGVEGEVFIARSSRELSEAAGDKWSVIPLTSKLREELFKLEVDRVAIVCLPCQAYFLWYMRMFPLLETDFSSKTSFIISLFCMGTFATEAFRSFIKKKLGVNPEDIISIKLRGEELIVKHVGGEARVRVEDVFSCVQHGCLVCSDYTGAYSDISAGVSKATPGYTIVITRSSRADKVFMEAINSGYLEATEAGDEVVSDIARESLRKMDRAEKFESMLLKL